MLPTDIAVMLCDFADRSGQLKASLGVDETWQQRAEVLRDELLRQSAIATETQDRIHWLRAQLRRQPGLQDKRMQEIVVLLVELAEMLPKDERGNLTPLALARLAIAASFSRSARLDERQKRPRQISIQTSEQGKMWWESMESFSSGSTRQGGQQHLQWESQGQQHQELAQCAARQSQVIELRLSLRGHLRPKLRHLRDAQQVADLGSQTIPQSQREAVDRRLLRALSVARPEKPLICLDWHNTVSFKDRRSGENYVPERTKQILRRCQGIAYDLAAVSFASNLATQRDVLNSARRLERELSHPFAFVHTVSRKHLTDPPTSRPSITGCVTCKAQEITRTGAAVYVDDQRSLSAEAEDLQRGRASQNRCRTLISHHTRPSAALEELERLLEEGSPADSGLPSFLRSLR
eukprot:s1173_g8.t1